MRHNPAPGAFLEKEGHRAVNALPPARAASAADCGLVAPVLCRLRAASAGDQALTAMAAAQQGRRPAGAGGLTPGIRFKMYQFQF